MYLVMPDRPDEADDGDGEEEDAAGGDASDDRERLHLVGSLAVGRDANQDEAHQLWGISTCTVQGHKSYLAQGIHSRCSKC